jgi:hypothetical protein
MAMRDKELLHKINLLDHRVAAIRLALAASEVRGDVRSLLEEQLDVAERSLYHARKQVGDPASESAHPLVSKEPREPNSDAEGWTE